MPEPRLALHGVALIRGGRTLLRDVSFALDAGLVVAVIGPNGAGKTSLLRAIAGTYPPDAGRVTLDGTDVHALAPRERARRVALVDGTEPVLAALTVADAVGAARFPYHRWWEWQAAPADVAAVAEALARTGLTAFAARELGTLSAGERQHVWIATALAQRAPLMLLDEPTSHLDLRASVATLHLLREIAAGGTTILAVLHQLEEAAAFADRVIVLGNGGIIADGTPDDALTAPTIARAFDVEVTVERRPEGMTFHRRSRV